MSDVTAKNISAFAAYKNTPKNYKESAVNGTQSSQKKLSTTANTNNKRKASPKQKNRSSTQEDAKKKKQNTTIPTSPLKTKKRSKGGKKEKPTAQNDRVIAPNTKSAPASSNAQPQYIASERISTLSSTLQRRQESMRKPTNGIATVQKDASYDSNVYQKWRETMEKDGSVAAGKLCFDWMLHPVKQTDFMANYWEVRPLCINRNKSDYLAHLVSTAAIDRMLRENVIEYTKNIDVTTYRQGVRETHNPEGRAMPSTVWNFYRDGCSIRLLNPQTFIPSIHELNATLQEYFHCMVGANIYLTPPNSQGFAPHFDDIEAFVLQIEGKKRWRLYDYHDKNEQLARQSSGNFKRDEIGQPIFERVLEPGDILYFPRGVIHEAQTVPGSHSLHITISVYQKTSFGDLMELLLPHALQNAINNDIDFRRGLPFNIWNQMGLVNSDTDSEPRKQIASELKGLFVRIINYADFDAAVDQMAITKYQHDALPPVLTSDELVRTAYGTQSKITEDGIVKEVELTDQTEFRLLRANILRLVESEDSFRLYFHVDNSKEYHEYDLNFFELESDLAPAIECLIKSYPNYVRIENLPLSPDDNQTIAQELWDRGLLITRAALN